MSLSPSQSQITEHNRECKLCEFSTTDAKTFNDHQVTAHGEQKQFNCENCGLELDSKLALETHITELCVAVGKQLTVVPEGGHSEKHSDGILENVMNSEVAKTMQLSPAPAPKDFGDDGMNNNEIGSKTAFFENNPDHPENNVANDGASTSPNSEVVSNTAANDSGFVRGSDTHENFGDLEEKHGHNRKLDVSDDNIELVIDEDAHHENVHNFPENAPPYIDIKPLEDNDGEVQMADVISNQKYNFSPPPTFSLINPKIFSSDALKNTAVFPGAAPPKTIPVKNNNSSFSDVTPPARRCAPVREAVDPAKYITVQEGDGVKYACSKCGNIYKWRKSLNKHWKEKHDGEIPEPRSNPAIPITALRGNSFARVGNQQVSPRQPRASPPRQDSTYSALMKNYQTYRPTVGKSLYGGKIENPFDAMRPGSQKSSPSPNSRRNNVMPRYYRDQSTMNRSYASSSVLGMLNQQPFFPTYLANTPKSSTSSPPPAHSSKPSPINIPRPAFDSPMDLTRELSGSQEGVLDLSMKSKRTSSPLVNRTSQDEPLDFSKPIQPVMDIPKPVYSAWSTPKKESSFTPYKPMTSSPVKESTPKPQQCKMCTYVTRDEQDMEAHIQLHTAQDIVCAVCQETFDTMDGLNQHFVMRHMDVLVKRMAQIRSENAANASEEKGGDQLYMYLTQGPNKAISSCVVCGAMYHLQFALARHFDQEHVDLPNPYRLPDSPENVGSPNPMEMDQMTESDGGKLYKCSQCPFTAGSTSELARHQIRHSLNKHHVCKVCGYTAKAKEELMEHYESEHPSIHPSDIKSSTGTVMLAPGDDSDDSQSESTRIIGPDGKSIIDLGGDENTAIVFPQAPEDTTRSRVGRKPNTASSVDVLLPYKCSVCEYRARWPSEITQHMKNHSDEKPFRCPRCTYKSKWKWDVVKHLKRCGGGTVKDVIDITKLPPYQMVQSHNPDNLAPTQNRELSNGPPNVTVVPTMDKSPYSMDYTPANDADNSTNTSPNGSSLECRECSFVASSVGEMRKHSKFHTYDVQQVYCSQCPFVGNNPAELKRHLRVHSDEKPFICKTCGYSSKWKCDLKKHCRTYNHEPAVPLTYGGHGRKPQNNGSDLNMSDDQNTSEYDSADAEYNGDSSINQMDNGERGQENTGNSSDETVELSCNYCPYMTTKRAMLDAHMKIHGQNYQKSQFKCKQCDHEAKDLTTFLQHKLLHTGAQSEGMDDESELPEDSGFSVDNDGKLEQNEPSSNRRKQSKQSIMKNKADVGIDVELQPSTSPAGASLYDNYATNGPADYSALSSSPADFSVKSFATNYQNYERQLPNHDKSDARYDHTPKWSQSPVPSYPSPNISPALSPVTGKPMYSEGKKTKRRLKTCTKCGYITDNVTTLQRHMAKHGKQGKYMCTHCDYSVDKQHVVEYHIRLVHGTKNGSPSQSPVQIPSPFEPDNTSNSTIDFNDAASVENASFGEQESVDFENADVGNLKGEDVKIVHIGNRTVYGCMKCSYNTMKASSVLKHSRQHGSNKKYNCTKCDYSVDHISHVRNHMKTIHGEDGLISRSETPEIEGQVNGDAFENHVDESEPRAKRMRWDSSTETPFACSNCSFEGENMTELVAHRCAHAQELKCEHCDYVAASTALMKLHAKTHAIKPGVKMHLCDKCPYRTASRSQLENHKKRHGLKSKHDCPYCDYSCGNTTQQGNHVKLHFPNQDIERDVLHLLMKGETVPGLTPQTTVSDSDLGPLGQGHSEMGYDEEHYDEEGGEKNDFDLNANKPLNGQFKNVL